MWLDKLKELKKASNLSSKQIAEQTNLPERTVSRIFSGDTEDPRADTLRRIVGVLGGSLDDLFAESGAVIGGKNLSALQEEVDRLNAEMAILNAENAVQKDQICALNSENALLRLELKYKEEIIAIHNYYIKRTAE